MTNPIVEEIVLRVTAGWPLVALLTAEEERVAPLAEAAAERLGRPLLVPRRPGSSTPLAGVLEGLDTQAGLVLLDDVGPHLADPVAVRLLGDLAATAPDRGQAFLLVMPSGELPPALARLATVIELPLPGEDELRAVLDEVAVEQGVLCAEEDAARLTHTARGLGLHEARAAIRRAFLAHPEAAAGQLASVADEKRRHLRDSRVLEALDDPRGLDDVGGLDQLKTWLVSRARAFSAEARRFGLPPPRGLLLMGVQGCGKSLSAKAVARAWNLPLLRLDLPAVFGAAHPEEALGRALRIAEAMAPTVLWIDELEKGFDVSDGTGSRILGGLVTWLQEKSAEVFVVATANRVANLPPELPRKGRFDDIFFVDLPHAHERREILTLHLRRHGRDPARFDLDALVRTTDRFTGAELEQVVIAGLYSAFNRGAELGDDDLRLAVRETVPLYETFEPEIKALREWARKRARPASTDRRRTDLFAE